MLCAPDILLNGIQLMILDEKNLIFVGSGDDALVDRISDVIFINTSFSRTKKINNKYRIDTLFMTDGYIDLNQVFNTKVIPGSTLEQTYKLRADKLLLFSKLVTQKIIIVSNLSSKQLKIGLSNLGIIYEDLLIISIRQIYLMNLIIAIRSKRMSSRHLVAWSLAVITNSKPPPLLRPSTGINAAVYFDKKVRKAIEFSFTGFLNDKSFYGEKMSEFEIHNLHEKTDLYLFRALLSKRVLTVSKKL